MIMPPRKDRKAPPVTGLNADSFFSRAAMAPAQPDLRPISRGWPVAPASDKRMVAPWWRGACTINGKGDGCSPISCRHINGSINSKRNSPVALRVVVASGRTVGRDGIERRHNARQVYSFALSWKRALIHRAPPHLEYTACRPHGGCKTSLSRGGAYTQALGAALAAVAASSATVGGAGGAGRGRQWCLLRRCSRRRC